MSDGMGELDRPRLRVIVVADDPMRSAPRPEPIEAVRRKNHAQDRVQNTPPELPMHDRVELTRYPIAHGLGGDEAATDEHADDGRR